MAKMWRRNTLMTVVCLYILLSDAANYVNCTKQKRQLFREHLLPEKGGKIPDSAFNPDRLLLNRLNQQGISVPDGVVLDHRRVEKHPFPKQNLPDTLKVVLTNDGRYVAPAGRYQYEKPPAVDTTYLVHIPHRSLYKGASQLQQQYNIGKIQQPIQYKQVDLAKWVPPIWYNHNLIKNMWNNNNNNNNKHTQDITDASQILAEYSSYLQKLHRDYDK